MGRAKARKPRREKKSTLAGELRLYDHDAVWALLSAAGASPGTRDQWTSVGLIASVLVSNSSVDDGLQPSSFAELHALVERFRADVVAGEDFIAEDPRLDVRVRHGQRVYRIFPGNVERPVADIDRAILLAGALDEELVPRMGFGVSDVLHVALGYVDFVIDRLSNTWPTTEKVEGVSKEEVAAAHELIKQLEGLTFDDPNQQAALDWLTAPLNNLPYDVGNSTSPTGRYIRAATSRGIRWLPISSIAEALGAAVLDLVAVAGSAETRWRFAQLSAATIRRRLWRSSDLILGAPDTSDGPAVTPTNSVQWIALMDNEHALALQMYASLAPNGDLPRELAVVTAARTAARSSGAATRVPLPVGSTTLPAGTELVPLLVVSVPGHASAFGPSGLASLSLEDLNWVASTADDENDLFMFCRDQTGPNPPRLLLWHGIDLWEHWRRNGKSSFSGGRQPDLIAFDPHEGGEEWRRAADWAAAEAALASLGLPPFRDFDLVSDIRSGSDAPISIAQWRDADIESPRPGVFLRPRPTGWSLWCGRHPVAVGLSSPEWSPAHTEFLHDLAGAITYGVRQISAQWAAAHENTDVAGYVLEFIDSDEMAGDSAFRLSSAERTASGSVKARVHVHVPTLIQNGDGDPRYLRSQLSVAIGMILGEANVPTEAAERVSLAWTEAAPTLTFEIRDVPTQRNDLPSPTRLDDAYLSVVDKSVATSVYEAGTRTGIYEGNEAKVLDRDVLAPAARDLLEASLAPYNADEVVQYAMEQLERTLDRKSQILRSIVRATEAKLVTDWDKATEYAETEAEYLTLRMCNELLAEAAIRTRPIGTKRITPIEWAQLLANAQAYLDATLRSETVHHQLTSSSLAISDTYEISTRPGRMVEDAYDFSATDYRSARATMHLADSGDAPFPSDAVQAEFDAAMVEAFGATPLEIGATLLSLAHWDLGDRRENYDVARREDVVAHVLQGTTLGEPPHGQERVEAAVNLLTTRAADLQAEPWKPWLTRSRRRRLLVQPLPELSDGRLVVAPHYLLGSLTMYQTYFLQGQLPWSQPAPPRSVESALERIRDEKNRQFERLVAEELRGAGYTTIENVRENEARRLGLDHLRSEIDCVAGRPNDPRILVIEAKDPADTNSAPEIRRAIDTFFRSGGKKRGYAELLARKSEDVSANPSRVAEALGLPSSPAEDPYRVKQLFVTRRPVPAAFVTSNEDFVVLHDLVAFLERGAKDEG